MRADADADEPDRAGDAGRGKTFEVFQVDQTTCKGVAQDTVKDAVKGQADATNQPPPAAAGAQKSAAAPLTVQQQYDTAYSKCMYAKGEQVAGYPPVAAPQARMMVGPDSALVRATQTELIRLHYFGGAADGVMGPMTGGAIRSFEQASGLPADGTVSEALLARLQSTPTAAAAPAATPRRHPRRPGGCSRRPRRRDRVP